jgi:hypothetical protein
MKVVDAMRFSCIPIECTEQSAQKISDGVLAGIFEFVNWKDQYATGMNHQKQ